jgi:hypothetical protein
MKRTIILAFLVVFYQLSFGQSPKTQIGWYHLLPGSKTKILVSYDRATNFSTNVWYATDEVLMIFESKNNIGYAIDIDGRIVQIDNMDKVKKIDTLGRVVKITKNLDVSLNKKLTVNNNVWLIGFNSAANTAKILLSSGEVVEIPKDTYVDIREYYDALGQKNKVYETSED